MTATDYFYQPANRKRLIADFFDNFPLEDAKAKLWELLKAAMENEQYVLEEKPSSTIYFYESLCDFLTATHDSLSNTNSKT